MGVACIGAAWFRVGPRWARDGKGGSGLEAMDVGGLKVASAGLLMAGTRAPLGSDRGDLMLGRLIKETN